MAYARNTTSKRDTEHDMLWLPVACWPFVLFSLGLSSFIALLCGPPGSFVLIFGVLVLLSWMVLDTDAETGRTSSLAPLAAMFKKLFTGR